MPKRSGAHRVAVWSTGGIGSLAIVAVHRRADLDLVGVWVHSADKVGRDAGELANGTPIGVPATDDVESLIALDPACVIYAASGPDRDAAAVPDYVRLLEAGINVVTTSSTNLVNPATFDPTLGAQLAAAAEKGGASIFASGIHPGFALDHLPVHLATMSKSIRAVRLYELALYDDYAVKDVMVDALGFALPLDAEPLIGIPGVIAHEFSGPIKLIAHELGLEIEEIRDEYDRRATDRDLEVAFGTAPAGTCGAIRMRAIGMAGGREAITVEHVTRLAADVAPEWPIGPGAVTHKVVIEGDPDMECVLTTSLRDPASAGIPWMKSGAGAMLATAMRVVNAVPFVVDAAPGILGAFDLPVTLPPAVFDVSSSTEIQGS